MYWFEQFVTLDLLSFLLLLISFIGIMVGILFIVKKKVRVFSIKVAGKAALILGALAMTAGLLLFYSMFIEPNLLQTKSYRYNIVGFQPANPVKVVVVGDLQAKAAYTPSYVGYLAERVSTLEPDYVIWVGDLLEGHQVDVQDLTGIQHIAPTAQKYAVLGNHDYAEPDKAVTVLEAAGFTLLRNQVVMDEQFIWLGTEDRWKSAIPEERLSAEVSALVQANPDKPVLLIAHQPTTAFQFDAAPPFSIVLTGHCHGGQVSLGPLNGLLGLPIVPEGCLTGKNHERGLVTERNQVFLVTPGVGSLSLRARFLVPPEISLLYLE